ncbi:hypothetical protein PG989_004553 [Apiospora arundinis]
MKNKFAASSRYRRRRIGDRVHHAPRGSMYLISWTRSSSWYTQTSPAGGPSLRALMANSRRALSYATDFSFKLTIILFFSTSLSCSFICWPLTLRKALADLTSAAGSGEPAILLAVEVVSQILLDLFRRLAAVIHLLPFPLRAVFLFDDGESSSYVFLCLYLCNRTRRRRRNGRFWDNTAPKRGTSIAHGRHLRLGCLPGSSPGREIRRGPITA